MLDLKRIRLQSDPAKELPVDFEQLPMIEPKQDKPQHRNFSPSELDDIPHQA